MSSVPETPKPFLLETRSIIHLIDDIHDVDEEVNKVAQEDEELSTELEMEAETQPEMQSQANRHVVNPLS